MINPLVIKSMDLRVDKLGRWIHGFLDETHPDHEVKGGSRCFLSIFYPFMADYADLTERWMG